MTARLEDRLKAAFDAATEFVQPPARLADRARHRARQRRRRVLAIAAAVLVLVVAAAAAGYGAAARRPAPANPNRANPARIELPSDYEVGELAIGGPYLYVLLPGLDALAAYNRATGKLVRQVTMSATPGGLTVGPGGLVWVDFNDVNWLLSPDLRLHSAMTGLGWPVLPTGRTTALMTDQYGLYRVSMPPPGSKGRASWSLEPGSGIGPPLNTAPDAAVPVGGHVVVLATDGYGYHGHLVIAGQPRLTYGGGSQTIVWGVAAVGNDLWAISGSNADNFGGAVVRLDSHLRLSTPAAIRRSRVLSRVAAIWSHGETVWVALGPEGWEGGHSLGCFRAGSRIGPVTILPVTGQVAALAATGDTVYVSAAPPGAYGAGVTSYRVPAACR